MSNRALLLVEDDDDDLFIMRRALERAGVKNPLYVVQNGQAAMEYLAGTGRFTDRTKYPLPVLVFLDLKLPLISGFDVLGWMRRQPNLTSTIVVVLTSSDHPSDIKTAHQLGANSYLIKPPTSQELIDMAKSFKWYWLEYNSFEPAND